MSRIFCMGNEAMGLSALDAGVRFVSGYPGTPSSEIVGTVAKNNAGKKVHVEWSVNEKAALEAAAGAAYAGARALVTMKQVGLNVAGDPAMSLAYIGVKGGLVIVSADDPGPISSQTEQDTRAYGYFSKIPVLDPQSPQEAYDMLGEAFEISEKYSVPVLLRPTTRVCHSCSPIERREPLPIKEGDGFSKSAGWVIFPGLSYKNHLRAVERETTLGDEFSACRFVTVTGSGKKGIAAGGVSCAYAQDALVSLGSPECMFFKVGTPYPFPEKAAFDFLTGLDEVLVTEELDPVIERALIFICGKYHLNTVIRGKLTHDLPSAGEYSTAIIKKAAASFLGIPLPDVKAADNIPPLPVRPPVLCAGCPHRAAFYAVKRAMKGKKAVFSGDIGCYTLGNAAPLDMVDTCLCMGAGVTIAQGLHNIEPDTVNFSFIGDSTFFHSGITGVINAVYNEHRIVLIVLDNSTTAMTGHQPHPGTGWTMMGKMGGKVDIGKVLDGVGVGFIRHADPFDLAGAQKAVKEAASFDGVSAVIFESPCIALTKPGPMRKVDNDKCVGCKRCITELGCPALTFDGGKAHIDETLCFGCGLCDQVCPAGALGKEMDADV